MTGMSRRHFNIGASAGLTATALGARGAVAQAYPTQDVHFVCSSAPGSGADVLVRYFAEKMRPYLNRAVIVENRVGALGNIATEYAARAKPDGHTIYIAGASALSANMHLFKKPPVDVGKAIQIVATINKQPTLLGVAASSPYQSVQDLTAAMKAKGDKATYATVHPVSKIMGELYKQKAGLSSVEVTYRASGDALNDLTSGNIDYIMIDNVAGMAQHRAGRLRMLAVSTGDRLGATGDIKTMSEQGIDIDLTGWWAAMVPSATPKPVVEQLNGWFNAIVSTEETKKFLNEFASDPWVSKADDAQAFFLQQIDAWGGYVRTAKIEPQG